MNDEEQEEEQEEQEDEDFDSDDAAKKLKSFYAKLTVKDLIIVMLFLMLIIMYVLHTRELDRCVFFYNDIIQNMTLFKTSMSYSAAAC